VKPGCRVREAAEGAEHRFVGGVALVGSGAERRQAEHDRPRVRVEDPHGVGRVVGHDEIGGGEIGRLGAPLVGIEEPPPLGADAVVPGRAHDVGAGVGEELRAECSRKRPAALDYPGVSQRVHSARLQVESRRRRP